MENIVITRDTQGRIKYNPILHPNMGTPWEKEDLEYLINWYDVIGVEEMALALGRTEPSVYQKVVGLRKHGLMSKPEKRTRIFKQI